jgi:hypothetical protein
MTLLFLFSALEAPFWPAFAMASLPLAASLVYVFGFRQGKPPAFDLDLIDYWVNGSGFGPRPRLRGAEGRKHAAD